MVGQESNQAPQKREFSIVGKIMVYVFWDPKYHPEVYFTIDCPARKIFPDFQPPSPPQADSLRH